MNPKKLLIGLAVAMAASVGLYLLMNARCYQLIGKLVCHGADDHKRIALTFDDAPSERTSDAVLAVLAEKNVKATSGRPLVTSGPLRIETTLIEDRKSVV